MTQHGISGRESPIRIEFEDEKTATLLDLLNQISDEIDENQPALLKVINPAHRAINKQNRNFVPPSLATSNTKGLADKNQQQQQKFYQQQQNYSNRSQTLPEINVITPSVKSSANSSRIDLRANEQPLSVAKLNSQQPQQQQPKPNNQSKTQSTGAITKSAPLSRKTAAPSIPPPPVSKNVPPFSVEMGRPGIKRPGYGRQMSGGGAYNENFDITLVDLDDTDMPYADNVSDVSSIGPMNSPTRAKFSSSERKMTKDSSVDKPDDNTNRNPSSGGSGSSSNRSAPNASNNERGRKWL